MVTAANQSSTAPSASSSAAASATSSAASLAPPQEEEDSHQLQGQQENNQQQQWRVLSIQSHVVSGYVGNKAAVFPLQLLGYDVDVVNSVQFSNHVGYPNGFEGDVLNGDQLRALLTGLERNGLIHSVGHLLTGYIGSESFLAAVLDVVKTLKRDRLSSACSSSSSSVSNSDDSSSVPQQPQAAPPFRFVCDPVLGDNGKFYVPKELVQVYRERVIPYADVITPNQFEAEQLTGISSIDSLPVAQRACRVLHTMGPRLVFITSLIFTENDTSFCALASYDDAGTSQKLHENNNDTATDEHKQTQQKMWRMDCPFFPGRFTGTGDLCASLLLAHTTALSPSLSGSHHHHDTSTTKSTEEAPEDVIIPTAMEKVMNTMYAVIQRTHNQRGTTTASCELKVIQSKRDIEHPPSKFKAQRIR